MEKKEIIRDYKSLISEEVKTEISAQQRGRIFEELICKLFKVEGILIHEPYYTDDNKAEQIDGAIKVDNRIILLEIKWVESGLAASDLYAFIGKIDNKLEGTLGLFISKEKLKDNFLNAITKGRRRNTMILHEQDIDFLFTDSFQIKDYISYLIELYSYNNILHFSASKYSEQQNIIKTTSDISIDQSGIDKSKVTTLIDLINSPEVISDDRIDIQIEEFNEDERIWTLNFLLKKYSEYRQAGDQVFTGPLYYRVRNAENIIKILLKHNSLIEKSVENYFKLIIEKQSIYYLTPMLWNKYRQFYNDYKNRDVLNDTIVSVFQKFIGEWNSENIITNVIEEIWSKLKANHKERIFWEYIEIYIDRHRRMEFEQKKYACKLIESGLEPRKKKYIKTFLEHSINQDIDRYCLQLTDVDNEVKSYNRKYGRLLLQLGIDNAEEYLKNIYTKFLKKKN